MIPKYKQYRTMTPKIRLNDKVRESIGVTPCGYITCDFGCISMSVSCVDWFFVEDEPLRHHRVRTLVNAITNWSMLPENLQDSFCMDGTRSQGYSIIDSKMFFWKIFWFKDEEYEEICDPKEGAHPILAIFTPSEKPVIYT